jgi:flagellar biosynthesis GTPase FlhF
LKPNRRWFCAEGSAIEQLVCTELTLQVRDAFFQEAMPVLSLVGPAGTGKTETLIDICKHTIGRPVKLLRSDR